MGEHQAPWERPEVASILSIFNGTVTSVKSIDRVQVNNAGGTLDGERYIQG